MATFAGYHSRPLRELPQLAAGRRPALAHLLDRSLCLAAACSRLPGSINLAWLRNSRSRKWLDRSRSDRAAFHALKSEAI